MASARLLILAGPDIEPFLQSHFEALSCSVNCISSSHDIHNSLCDGVVSKDPYSVVLVDINKIGIDLIEIGSIFQTYPEARGVCLTVVAPDSQRGDAQMMLSLGYDKILFHSDINFDAILLQRRPRRPGDPLRILIVDDDGVVATRVLQFTLTKQGIVVDTALDGKEGIEKCKQFYYDAILVDCNMPEMDGYEFAKLYREIEKRDGIPHTPVIAVTGIKDPGHRERCISVGMDEYLEKPVAITELNQTIKKFLREKMQNMK